MLVALRMLIPYQKPISGDESAHDSYDTKTETDVIGVRIEESYPIRYIPADTFTVERIMSDILNMYIAAKLSRRRKAKKVDQGLREVGEKLKVLEKESSFDNGSESPLNRKRTPENSSPRCDSAAEADEDPICQKGEDLRRRNSHLLVPSPTSPKDIARQPHVLQSSDDISRTAQKQRRHVQVNCPNSLANQLRHPKMRSHNTTQTSLTAPDLNDSRALPEGLRERIWKHGTHAVTRTHVLSKNNRWKTLQTTTAAGSPSAPVEPSQLWREASRNLDSDDDIADQLFWKDEVKRDDSATLPVINYSHPRRAILNGSDLPVTHTLTSPRSGSAKLLPNNYQAQHVNSILSYASSPRGTSDTDGTRLGSSPVNWELSAFDDEVADGEAYMNRAGDDFSVMRIRQGEHVEQRQSHGVSTQTMENGELNNGMAYLANVGTALQPNATRRESAVWNVT
ncbi:hypothetical protein QFC21_004718 [Naganishia friedmannii]|uniref:Uncharacterized protein n=1 Tax=Naganishia friedmannii TaxID=89922 RepID=A0ACC2VFQ5_9TREE|nr:hypothetical protein QFC21_004718 [Naganishia friedmannii]